MAMAVAVPPAAVALHVNEPFSALEVEEDAARFVVWRATGGIERAERTQLLTSIAIR
jgi:hypothetical protein